MIAWLTRVLPPIGWVVLGAALLLSALGLLGIRLTEADAGGYPAATVKQAAYLLVGLSLFAAAQLFGYRRVLLLAYPIFAVILLLLILLVVARYVPLEPFIRARRNTYRWIELGPVSLQVSELAKVAYIVALAAYLRFRTSHRTFAGLLWPFVFTLLPVALILKEPDLGTSLLLPPTLFVMVYAAGAKLRHLLTIVALVAVAAPIFYFSPLMSEYQRDRIRVLARQDRSDEHWHMGAGYQLNQSKVALGSGRFFGRGLRDGAFFRHNLLPEEHNDFIFAVLGYQWGFVGCLLVILLYLLLVGAGLTVATMTTDPFGRLLAVGVSALLAVQTAINVGMTMGLMPVTGMTLPFVSSGGSALIANYLGIGLLVSVARRRVVDMARKPFEFDAPESPA